MTHPHDAVPSKEQETGLLETIEQLRALSPKPTVEPNSQHWAGMDGAIAYHLIDRHADNWADIALMMNEWLEANRRASSPAGEAEPMAHFVGYSPANQRPVVEWYPGRKIAPGSDLYTHPSPAARMLTEEEIAHLWEEHVIKRPRGRSVRYATDFFALAIQKRCAQEWGIRLEGEPEGKP